MYFLWQVIRSYEQTATVAQEAQAKLFKVQAQRAKGKHGEAGGKKEMKVRVRVYACVCVCLFGCLSVCLSYCVYTGMCVCVCARARAHVRACVCQRKTKNRADGMSEKSAHSPRLCVICLPNTDRSFIFLRCAQCLEKLMVNKKVAIKNRNSYLLQLRSANVLTQRYFGETVFELFEVSQHVVAVSVLCPLCKGLQSGATARFQILSSAWIVNQLR